jgi:hypothetical protein
VLLQDRDRRTMLFEERLEAAERRRLEGNTLFAQQQYKEALAKYALVSWGHTGPHQGLLTTGSTLPRCAVHGWLLRTTKCVR